MNPGRELDALIAEKVMENWNKFSPDLPKHYSTSIEAAFEVLGQFNNSFYLRNDKGKWMCQIAEKGGAYTDTSAAHAICLAALIAVGG